MVRVSKITWISEDALEAEVLINDGTYEIKCFSHPFNMLINAEIQEPIYCYNTQNVIVSFKNENKVFQVDKSFEYHIIGELVDKENELVRVGEILIKLEENSLPTDINLDKYIEFSCNRFDIY